MEVDFPVSRLMRLRDELTAPNCQNIHDKGTANLAALADYGITAQMLADLQDLIDRYSADTPKPRSAISSRKTTTANLAALFDQTDRILKERMDKIVVLFRSSQPVFVETYENARRIIDPATTTTQLKGKVTDKSDSSPVKNATVTAVRTENGTNGQTFTTAIGRQRRLPDKTDHPRQIHDHRHRRRLRQSGNHRLRHKTGRSQPPERRNGDINDRSVSTNSFYISLK